VPDNHVVTVGRAHSANGPAAAPGRASGGVQSIERVFELLEAMADSGGIVGLSQLAARSGLPLPTIHRLIRTLVDLGYVRQEPTREYALGPRLVRLGDGASRLLGTWATPHLRALVDSIGESANLAMLDGAQVVYAAQAPGRHSMRMFTEVGRRAWVHCTAVGKAMLALLPEDEVVAIINRCGMPRQTEHTITDIDAFLAELRLVRARGYAIDEGEQELGVRCVAVALPGKPVRAAVSVSGPLTRMTDELVAAAVPQLSAAALALADELHLASASARSGADT
jgi:IclR family acetate operon transcriptional repressor